MADELKNSMPRPTSNAIDAPQTQPTRLTATSWARFSPLVRASQKGIWILSQIAMFFTYLLSAIGSLWRKYQQVVLSLIALAVILIVFRVALAVVDALNDIPLLAPTFQLVGIGYSLWFIRRYLLFASNRQELGQSTQTVFHQQIKELGAGEKHQLSEEQEQSKQHSEIALASANSGTANIADDRSEPELAVTNGEQSRANFETPARLVDEVASLSQQELTNQETEQDITNAQSQQVLYKPGEIVPTSGQYEVIGSDGVSQKREITSTKGEHFPPAPESGMHYRLVDATVHQGSQRLAQSIVVNSDETEQLYKPGEIVPISGQYQVINPDGVSQGREVTSTKGEHFPPTKESGMHYRLVDATIHQMN